ncbi:MAG: type II toxin-antitoxin system RelE/ParE family toxin [Alphaproteobacteria bacterium]|nr:type II toxin-antitoxin system RelE/ParE family toxin [Alphaproteobacteria bacterium]
MIVRFRHKGLKRLFEEGSASGVSARQAEKIRQILAMLNVCTAPEDIDVPGLRLHPLKGDLKGKWAVSVSGNWRIIFAFDGKNVTEVDLVDYH